MSSPKCWSQKIAHSSLVRFFTKVGKGRFGPFVKRSRKVRYCALRRRRDLRLYVRFGEAARPHWNGDHGRSGPRAGCPRFARARAEGEPRWTARRGWANTDGHRQKGGRPEAALNSWEETAKEGIYGREPAPQRGNGAMQQLQARFCRYCSLADRACGPMDPRP